MAPPLSILQHPSAPINGQVSIAQISAGGMVLHWYESVAIVRELCETLGNQSGHPMLDWSSVFVHSSGDVTIRSSDSNDPNISVRAIGELLRTWLAETPYPRPLSLVVAQCTSTPSFYRSPAELSKALSHYERPNRLELIRNVYERWRSADPASHEPPAESPSSADALRPKAPAFGRSVESGEAVPTETARRKFPWVRRTAAATLVIAIIGALIAWGIGRPAATTVGSALGRADDRLTDAVAGGFGAALNWAGRRFTRMPTSESTPPSAVPPIKTARRSTAKTAQTPTGGSAVDPFILSGDQAAAPPAALQEPAPPSPPPFDMSIVYSAENAEVTPPIAINRQLQDPPSSAVALQLGIVVEIVVDQMGRVESATLAKAPPTLREAMQATMDLHNVKSWRFRPALKADQPVKYRRIVWLANR